MTAPYYQSPWAPRPERITGCRSTYVASWDAMTDPCCHRCADGRRDEHGLPLEWSRMFVCPKCGNKRCPKASDHDLPCSGSNEPGQPGSVYR